MSTAGAGTMLVIEDEISIRRFLRPSLEAEGFTVVEAVGGEEGLALAATRHPDLVLLDLGLPDLDGIKVIQRLRDWSTVPIIVLTARGKEEDKIQGLDAGADDYLTKPFSVPELLARIRVALRHARRETSDEAEPVFDANGLHVDMAARVVRVQGREIHLTPQEYDLLVLLVRHAGKVVTQKQILKAVWGHASTDQGHYVRLYVHQIRNKIEANPARPKLLFTEPGVGYRLKGE
jgi:two-component system KDP operon response regulator KdpE